MFYKVGECYYFAEDDAAWFVYPFGWVKVY